MTLTLETHLILQMSKIHLICRLRVTGTIYLEKRTFELHTNGGVGTSDKEKRIKKNKSKINDNQLEYYYPNNPLKNEMEKRE